MSDFKYGVNTAAVEAVIAEIASWTVAEAQIAGKAWGAAWYPVRNVAWAAVRDAGRGKEFSPACDAARDAVGNMAWGAAQDAAYEAVLCAFASDLISEEHREVLNAGLNAVREQRGA